jgi:hypothetical protein
MTCNSQIHERRCGTSGVLYVAALFLIAVVCVFGIAYGQRIAVSASTSNINTDSKAMTPTEASTFVDAFTNAWRTRNGADFAALWHPHGKLVYPFANRVIQGSELPTLNAITTRNAPDLTWKLIDWTTRGNVVVIEWESSNRYGERVVTWRGVDKLTLQEGKIIEEIVYTDTAPLQAMRRGELFDPLIVLPAQAN